MVIRVECSTDVDPFAQVEEGSGQRKQTTDRYIHSLPQ